MSSISDFKRLNKIGQGAFGIAWLVESKIDCKKYVLKEIGLYKMHEKERFEARKEVSLLSKMNHPNIVTYYNSFEEAGCFHILMEYCDGGDLYRRIKTQNGILFKEEQVLDYFIQICLALKHIHDQRILHRDIKPQNVFLTKNNSVKLGDFGIAKAMDSTTALTKTQVGTPFYFSPEICEGCPYNNKSDIWSLGCILYELCSLNYAFYGQDITILAMRIKKVNYKPIPSVFSAPLRALLDNMFRRRPDERPNINTILRRPFILKKIDKFLPPESLLLNETKKAIQKRPSTASVVSRVDSGLSNKKKARVGRDQVLINSPYIQIPNRNIHDKRVSPRIVKQDPNPLVVRQQELNNKFKSDMINLDRENGWKNVLSSDDSKSDSKESKLNAKLNAYGVTPPAAIKQKVNSPAYDRYYAELDRIKEQQVLRENEGRALMQQMMKQNDNKPSDGKVMKIGGDGLYRKVDASKPYEERNRMNELAKIHGKIGANAADQAVIQEFIERKRQAKNIKNRNGSGMAFLMGGPQFYGEQSPVPRQTPRSIEEETAERLNKIRQKNFEIRQGMGFEDFVKKSDIEGNGNFENYNQIEARKALEELKKRVKQKTDELKQKLEKREKERNKELPSVVEDDLPNNAILFPKRTPPAVVNKPEKPPVVSLPTNEPSSISVILEKMHENVTPAGDAPKVDANEFPESLSVVLSQLDDQSRPSTASSSEPSEIRRRKDDILKRLNMKHIKASGEEQEKEETKDKETPRKSWIFDMNENNICIKNNLDNTISDCGTMTDVSVLQHDDDKTRAKWQIDDEISSDTVVLQNIKLHQDSGGSTVVLDQPSIEIDVPTISESSDCNENLTAAISSLSTIIEASQEIMEITLKDEKKVKSNFFEREEVWNENVASKEVKVSRQPNFTTEVKNEISSIGAFGNEKNIQIISLEENNIITNIDDDISETAENSDRLDSSGSDTEDLIECFKNALSIDISNSSSSKSVDNLSDKTINVGIFNDQGKISNANSLQDLTQKPVARIRRTKSYSDFEMNLEKEWFSDDTFSSEDFGDEEILNPGNIFLKIEKIRAELEEKIGIDSLMDAMEFVRENQDLNGDQLAEKLKDMVGDEASINDILQLVVLEEQYHNVE